MHYQGGEIYFNNMVDKGSRLQVFEGDSLMILSISAGSMEVKELNEKGQLTVVFMSKLGTVDSSSFLPDSCYFGFIES